jgi:glutamine synthetase
MIRHPSRTILEYIWIGGKNELRSKTRVVNICPTSDPSHIPEWNYDGSSTWQADSNGDTEIILKPCAIYKDPFRDIDDSSCLLLLCDTYDTYGNLTPSNHRHLANNLFEKGKDCEPWFGLEQEYFIILPESSLYKICCLNPDDL